MLVVQKTYQVEDRRHLDSQIPAARHPGLPGLADVAAETFELHRLYNTSNDICDQPFIILDGTRPTTRTASWGWIYLTDVVLFVRSCLCSPNRQFPDDWIFINVCLVPGIPPERTVPTGGRTIHEMRETKSTGQSA